MELLDGGNVKTDEESEPEWAEHQKWKVVNIKSWSHFDKQVDSLNHRQWLFRGQADATWGLETSLFRLFNDLQHVLASTHDALDKDEYEKCLVERFQANAHRFLSWLPESDNVLEWLAIMQHYGAPSRLLDLTQSPHIATYFALEALTCDCAVFAINHKRLEELDDSVLEVDNYRTRILEGLTNTFLRPYEPRMTNDRLAAQQGVFLVPSNNSKSVDWMLGEYGSGGKQCIKFVIPAILRKEGLQRLRRMNISAGTLFPGIDGFCRSLRFGVLDAPETWKRIQ